MCVLESSLNTQPSDWTSGLDEHKSDTTPHRKIVNHEKHPILIMMIRYLFHHELWIISIFPWI